MSLTPRGGSFGKGNGLADRRRINEMKGTLIYNTFWDSPALKTMGGQLTRAAQKRNIELEIRTNAEFLYAFPGGGFLKPLPDNDFCLFWDKDVRLASMLENAGQRLFNSSRAIALCDDKTLTHMVLKDLPGPRTIICPQTFRYNGYPKTEFLDEVESVLSYPMIVKEGRGSFGMQVYLTQNREELLDILWDKAGGPLLFQEFIRESRGHDLRLYMAGGQCLAAMRRVNETDFRANIRGGGHAEPYTPGPEEIELANAACEKLGLTFAGVDLLESDRGPLICEVNSNAHFIALENLTHADVAGGILDAVISRLSR